MQQIDMEMERIKLVGPLPHRIQHHHMIRYGVDDTRGQSQRRRRNRNKLSRCLRIAAREQGHFMPLMHQRLCEIGDDPFGTPIKLGRHTFSKGSDLSDLHAAILYRR